MKSSSQFSFAQVPQAQIPRSSFDRSRTYKTAFDEGYLVPIYVDEVLPGDTFNLSLTSFMRLATPIVPFMDNLYADFFFFFVPNRLVWDNWQRFCGERDSPVADYDQDTVYQIPQVDDDSSGFGVGSLADYFGLPTGVTGLSVSALPFRAYNLIWNEWFRDENLQQPAILTTDDTTVHLLPDFPLQKRGKRHDYFTSCLPWPQKGPGVEIPLGGYAPVVGNGIGLGLTDGTLSGAIAAQTGGLMPLSADSYGKDVGTTIGQSPISSLKVLGLTDDPDKSGMVADLSAATAATINSLREAFQVQKLYERDARGGTRYVEILRSHFGVVSPDARLQRPEYLGGGQIPIQIHAVAQTSSSDQVTPQGNLAATGTASGKVGFSKSFVEHGYVIGLVSVRADLTYQQGIDRMWSRSTRFDFYWPALAHLGEQAVYNKEIYAQGSSVVDSDGKVVDEKVFGYQERWAEYRYGVSKITGILNANAGPSNLSVWHLAQTFGSLPTLSSTFIEENPPVSRVLAVPTQPHFIYDSLIKCSCVRPMPTYSVPGYMDHF